MDGAASAIGIAAFGIQICQSLLDYYDSWKSYGEDIRQTYDSTADLSKTLTLLKESLEDTGLDQERADRVKSCLRSCETSLAKLFGKAQKLRKDGQPQGMRQKAWAELQKAWYPFRASTLVRLREINEDVHDHLRLALQVLQLDASQRSQRVLVRLDQRTSDIAKHIQAMQQSDHFRKITAQLSPPNPWTNHRSARDRHEPQTGSWLLKSQLYQNWKAGTIAHL